jgi:uncharacterized membrane protein
MKMLAIVAIVVGVVLIILGIVSSASDPTRLRSVTAAGVVLLGAGLILYRRGRRRDAA